MFYKKVCGVAAGLFLLCGVAQAQVYSGDVYVGVNYVALDYEYEGGDFRRGDTRRRSTGDIELDVLQRWNAADYSLKSLYGKIGKFINENISAELRVGLGIGDDSADITTTIEEDKNTAHRGETVTYPKRTRELKHFYGGYIRAGASVNESFYPYLIGGYTSAKFEWEFERPVEGFDVESHSESSFSWGVGADIYGASNAAINIEFMNYLDKDNIKMDGVSIGYIAKF